MKKKIFLITGGAGFIGSALIRHILMNTEHGVVNVDKLTYAGNLDSLKFIQDNNQNYYAFEQVDICDKNSIKRIFFQYKPDAIINLAAESHVDRSIDSPNEFIQSNIYGTYVLLEESRVYWSSLNGKKKNNFRFHHVSTEEVYGDLEGGTDLFTEDSPYNPSSPYSASKASSDFLVRAWHRTFNLPTLITTCSNNYGPYQFPEKLIPLMITNCIDEKPLPVYGEGLNIRDWLYVDDHCEAIFSVLHNAVIGETYNIGGNNEVNNIDIVKTICSLLDELKPRKNGKSYKKLITYVEDRPGHDYRYAIDSSKIKNDLGWTPNETFKTGIRKTIQWYLDNEEWWRCIQDGSYAQERLGLNFSLKK